MTGYDSKRAAAQNKLLDDDDALTIAYQSGYYDGKKAAHLAQEPVAWMHVQGNYEEPSWRQLDDDEIERGWKQYPLYTTPPQEQQSCDKRPWVGLTEKEKKEIYRLSVYVEGAISLTEAKLKEKNT